MSPSSPDHASPEPDPPLALDEQADTRTRLLDVAEHLFARQGIASTSLRHITSDAGANLAAVNYHFGSKSGLIEAVYARRIRPLNEERLRLLREAEAAAGADPIPIEVILRSFLEPVREMASDPARGGDSFLQLMARANLEPTDEIHRLVYRQFLETGMQYFRVLQRSVPHLAPSEIFVRFRFMIGAMFFTVAHALDPGKLGAPPELTPASDAIVHEDLIRFLAAGFRAGSPSAGSS